MSITYSLTIVKGGKVGQTFKVDRPNAALGRHSGHNDIVLTDPYISSQHARILYNSGQFFLEDLGSTNKTFVNGVALIPNKPVALFNGMEFVLGKTGFRFQHKPRPQPTDTKSKKSSSNGKSGFLSLQGFHAKNIVQYTPVLLGIALWALVVVIFWVISITLGR